MPILTDFFLNQREDATLTVSMSPPVAIGGWSLLFTVQKYFGQESGYFFKSVSSGLNGASGITVVNSGQGIFAIDISSFNTSGLNFGNYAYAVQRTDSGQVTLISQGYMLLGPNVGA